MSTTFSDATKEAIARGEPFVPEAGFAIDTPEIQPESPPQRRKGGRGHKGPNWIKNAKKKGRPVPSGAEEPPADDKKSEVKTTVVTFKEEPPKTLVRGCRWILRNVVLMMEEGWGWDRPEDYEEWLIEASQFGASCVQRHFPDWMDRWGDEILFLAMMLVWITPNVGKKLRERRKQNNRLHRPEGQRENDTALQVAKSA